MTPEGNAAKGRRLLLALIAVQALAAAIAAFVPFGFDHPSALGLDFGHLLVLLGLYGVALLAGLVTAAVQRRWQLGLFQLALAAAAGWFTLSAN